MATLRNTNISCGVREMHGFYMDTPAEGLREAFERYGDRGPYYGLRFPFAHVIFSDRMGGNGKRYAAFITKRGLGTITESPIQRNPNSGNRIRVWVWTINKPALTRWL